MFVEVSIFLVLFVSLGTCFDASGLKYFGFLALTMFCIWEL